MLDISIPTDGPRNLSLLARGVLDDELSLTPLLQKPRKERIKLTAALWLIQEKLGLVLWWEETPEGIIIPMESRNSVRLDRGWDCPQEWKGQLYLSSFGYATNPLFAVPKHFVFELDFDKQ